MAATIEIDDVCVSFDGDDNTVVALEGVNLDVGPGEFVSCVGPSGCGKTTLLRVLAGGLEPTSGSVRFGAGRGRVGVVFQEHSLLPWRTTIDNVAFGLEIAGIDRKDRRRIAGEYLDLVGLTGFETCYPRQLSGGMKQRANLARALAIDPDVLLMDEPFAALDAQTKEVMQSELLNVWSETRHTVIFITHQIDEAIYLSDRVIAMSRRPGKVKAELTIDLDRPRPLSVKRTPKFVEYADQIWSLLDRDIRAGVDASTRATTGE
jgi:NitT/TauT family transport system ATP-binding protein